MNRSCVRYGLGVAVSLCLLTFSAMNASADEAPPPKAARASKRPPPDPNKAKLGDRCKTSSDCDHSHENVECVEKGDHKECQQVPSKRPLVPVVT